MYSLSHNGAQLHCCQSWRTVAATLRAKGVNYLIVEAIEAWFDMHRGKVFKLDGFVITEEV